MVHIGPYETSKHLPSKQTVTGSNHVAITKASKAIAMKLRWLLS